MSASEPSSLASTLETSIVLCARFASSLAPDASFEPPSSRSEPSSPLPLLSASATALKSQVTKLSLLATTAPFTPSAVTTCLLSLNESILTSLITSTLLISPDDYTTSFSTECRSVAGANLRDMQALLCLVQSRSKDTDLKAELSDVRKKAVREATGRVWDRCDKLVILANEGLPGFVARRSKEWLELMKDAVKELEEWDPEEEVDDAILFGDNISNNGEADLSDEEERDADRVAISAGVKDQALKVLNRIPQSIHVVIKQRLEKIPHSQQMTTTYMNDLGHLLTRTRHISELIDESAEAMYLGDPELCLRKAGEARAVTIDVVESVILSPFGEASNAGTEKKEDKYVRRALEWIQQVDPGGVPRSKKAIEGES